MDGQKNVFNFGVDVECDYYDVPSAKANKGIKIRLLDDGLNYPVIYSDGDRYRALGHQIVFKPTFNTVPTRGNTLIKHAEIKIPYSPNEGSLWGNDDTLQLCLAHERINDDAGDSAKTLNRAIHIGKSTTITDNIEFLKLTAPPADHDITAEGKIILARLDCTTVRAFGNSTRYNNWGGSSNTDGQYGEWGTTSIDNMDMFDTYIQVGFIFSATPIVDAVRSTYFEAIINTCGVR